MSIIIPVRVVRPPHELIPTVKRAELLVVIRQRERALTVLALDVG